MGLFKCVVERMYEYMGRPSGKSNPMLVIVYNITDVFIVLSKLLKSRACKRQCGVYKVCC